MIQYSRKNKRSQDAPYPATAADRRPAPLTAIETGFDCRRCGGPIVLVRDRGRLVTRCMHCDYEVRP